MNITLTLSTNISTIVACQLLLQFLNIVFMMIPTVVYFHSAES